MANTAQPPEDDDVQTQRDIDEVFSRANPNPDRVGCPPRDELIALAARRLPIGSPGYEHLSKCSPCYREFRALQMQAAPKGTRRVRWWLSAVAAALVLVTVGAWWLSRGREPVAITQIRASTEVATAAELDLRPFTVTRSDQAIEAPPSLLLPPRLMDLTLLLPVGAEAGAYDVQLLDAERRARGAAVTQAAIENYVTTMRVRLDLRQLPEGPYQLAVRRQGDSWREYPLAIGGR